MIPIISKINNELLIVRLGGVLDTEMVNMIAIELNSIEAAGTYPKRIAFVDETLVIAIKSDNVMSYKMRRLEPIIVTKTAFCVFTDLQFGIAPMIRKLCKETGFKLGEIYQMFPSGPAKGACKLAGLPKPTGGV